MLQWDKLECLLHESFYCLLNVCDKGGSNNKLAQKNFQSKTLYLTLPQHKLWRKKVDIFDTRRQSQKNILANDPALK